MASDQPTPAAASARPIEVAAAPVENSAAPPTSSARPTTSAIAGGGSVPAKRMIAAENDCRETLIEVWTGCDDVATVPRSCLHGQAGRVLTLDSTIAPTGTLN